jgi:DNA repair exonuclease SbcCD ATPase subunit
MVDLMQDHECCQCFQDYAGPVREMIISNKDVNDQLLFSFLEIVEKTTEISDLNKSITDSSHQSECQIKTMQKDVKKNQQKMRESSALQREMMESINALQREMMESINALQREMKESNERSERREKESNERSERREKESNERSERREKEESNERSERREKESNERSERREKESNERSERREKESNERSERREKESERREKESSDAIKKLGKDLEGVIETLPKNSSRVHKIARRSLLDKGNEKRDSGTLVGANVGQLLDDYPNRHPGNRVDHAFSYLEELEAIENMPEGNRRNSFMELLGFVYPVLPTADDFDF